MTRCSRIVCGCQLWEYSNDLDCKEFCVGSIDFIKGRVVSEFTIQLLLINRLRLQLHSAIYRSDSFVIMLRYYANLKAIRYESTSLNRIVADKSHRVIVASDL